MITWYHRAHAALDPDVYAAEMLDYYEYRMDGATEQSGEDYAREYDQQYATPGHWLREVADAIQAYLAGRRVLEIAAGHGRWTRYLVRTAAHVSASDSAPRALSRIEAVVRYQQNLPTGRFVTMKLDAFCPDEAPGEFDAALVVNWFQHVPVEQQGDFIRRLHSKLRPGSRVMLAINHIGPAGRAKLFKKRGDPNTYEHRQTFEGRPYDIVDNLFTESDLRTLFAPRARELQYTNGNAFHWICYELR